MGANKRLFLILWLAGFAGVLSLLLIDISALVHALPQPEGSPPVELPPPALLKLATMGQPTMLLILAVIVGIFLAPRVGLHAPAAEALAKRLPVWPAIRPQLVPGIVFGILSGTAIVATWVIAKSFLTPEFLARAEEFNKLVPHAARFLYGGFTEELLLRWGVMTFLVWLQWRILGRGTNEPSAIYFVIAIVLSAVVFGLGHLPVASALAGELTLPLVLYVIIANSIFGIVAGFLYWRRGLESAMLAHMLAHVVLIMAINFGI